MTKPPPLSSKLDAMPPIANLVPRKIAAALRPAYFQGRTGHDA
jgi:hypothetical protein